MLTRLLTFYIALFFFLSVPSLTQNLVSQSFQAVEVMSERVYSEQLTVQEVNLTQSQIVIKALYL